MTGDVPGQADAIAGDEGGFRSFVENSPYGIFRSTLEGRLLTVNRALIELLGYASAADLRAKALVPDICATSTDPTGAPALRLVAGGRPVESRWRKLDGSLITVRVWARELRPPGSSTAYVEGFVEDVTPLRAAEEALRQSEKLAAVGHLVSGVAHELNNPLSAILLFAEDLLVEPRPPADAEALVTIRDQARRSRAIVRDLLTFAQGQLEVRTRVDARAVLEELSRVLRTQLQAQGVQLELDVGGTPLDVDVDRAGIEQVITNLVVNGAQATGANGTVRIAARRDGEDLRVEVTDDGPGIPPGILADIFNPFFTTQEPGKGTGLGLTVALAIVERHRGRLRAETRARDGERGARFVMQIPLAGALFAPVPLPPEPVERRSPSRSGPVIDADVEGAHRLLIIDDEEAIRTALRRYFTRRNWQVHEALDGAVGLRSLLTAPPDYYTVVISDLRMPGLSGMALHDRLAAERPDLLRKLILATGDVTSADVAGFLARTHCPVLHKPYELSALARVFDAIVGGQPAPT